MEVDALIADPTPARAGAVNTIMPVSIRITVAPRGKPLHLVAVANREILIVAGSKIPQAHDHLLINDTIIGGGPKGGWVENGYRKFLKIL